MISTMRDLEIGFVEHVETTSEMDLDKNIKYKERILRGLVLKKYRQGLAECKDSKKGVAVYHWNPGPKNFLPWNSYGLDTRWTLSTEQEIFSLYWRVAPTLRRSCGSSWERERELVTGSHYRNMLNTTIIIF